QSSLAGEYASEEGQLESEGASLGTESEQRESSGDADFASELGGLAAPNPDKVSAAEATEAAGFKDPFSMPELSVAETETEIDTETDVASSDEGLALPGLESDGFGLASEMAVDTAEMTMASVPLPYPPFGGPEQQQQQPTMPDVSGTLIEAAPTAAASSATAASTGASDNVIETINIVGASDQNALESSIDAILHSVLQEYESESTPKAAVGFALIHARRQAMTASDAE
ncbi:hypothetical protein LPJ75_006631, partial [Coemansia sp. RSA 2598]